MWIKHEDKIEQVKIAADVKLKIFREEMIFKQTIQEYQTNFKEKMTIMANESQTNQEKFPEDVLFFLMYKNIVDKNNF